MGTIDRRRFLIGSALLAASGALAATARVGAGLGRLPDMAQPPAMVAGAALVHPVAVARGANYGDKLKQAVVRIGGVSLMGKANGHVVIKPTLAWNRAPDQGANVHPDVLRSAIEMALAAAACQVTVFDRTSFPSHWAYRVSGAEGMVKSLGSDRVTLAHLTESDFVSIAGLLRGSLTPEQTAVLSQYRVCRYLLDADHVINIATARQHPQRGASLGMANLLGLVGGGPADADWLRRQDMDLAVLSAAVQPDLTILDATRAVVRNGPMGRDAQDIERWDTLVVSRDPLAVEAYGARLFGLTIAGITLAKDLGVGSPDLDGRVIEI